MKNIIIYSANIGGYDSFKEMDVYDNDIRYILYTDSKNIKSKKWEIKNISFIKENISNIKKARFVKINSHLILPNHDISIWIDHCFRPKINCANDFVSKTKFLSGIMCYKHDERDCTYKESKVIISRSLDDKNIVENQMDKYRRDGFPDNHGLYQSGFMVRSNEARVNNFNNFWWNEVLNNSHRDQLSQVYSAWKNSISIQNINSGESVYNNPFLDKKIKHNKF